MNRNIYEFAFIKKTNLICGEDYLLWIKNTKMNNLLKLCILLFTNYMNFIQFFQKYFSRFKHCYETSNNKYKLFWNTKVQILFYIES